MTTRIEKIKVENLPKIDYTSSLAACFRSASLTNKRLQEMDKLKKPNKKLQHERELHGWSQARVAEKLGTTVKRVANSCQIY
jgi:DNA-directed RNA polymerase specialized sigma24 family protein